MRQKSLTNAHRFREYHIVHGVWQRDGMDGGGGGVGGVCGRKCTHSAEQHWNIIIHKYRIYRYY